MEHTQTPVTGTLGELIETVKGLNEYELREAITFARILAENDGCNTPQEHLIVDLVSRWGWGNGALPIEAIEDDFETFRSDYKCMVEIAQRVARLMPEVVRPILESKGKAAA